MAILSCVYIAFSGDDHGVYINLNLRYFYPFRGMCLAIVRPIFHELSYMPAEICCQMVIIVSMTSEDNLGPMSYLICSILHPFWGLFLALAGPFSLNCYRCWPWLVVQI